MIVRIVSGEGEFAHLHCSISISRYSHVIGICSESNIVPLHLGIGRDDVQDTSNAFCIVFGSWFSYHFNGLDGIGRQTAEHFFWVVAHQRVRLSVYVYLEIAGTIYLYVVFSVDGNERYFPQHFEGGIGLGVRVVFYTVRNFIDFGFYKRFLSHYFHAFQHLGIIASVQRTQVGHPFAVGDGKMADYCAFSYRGDLQSVFPGLRQFFLEFSFIIGHIHSDRFFRRLVERNAYGGIGFTFMGQ